MKPPQVIATIFAVIVLAMSLIFPNVLRGADKFQALVMLVQLFMVAILVGPGLFDRSDGGKIGVSTSIKYGAIWLGLGFLFFIIYSQLETLSR
jgi:hypothetical protein